MNRPWEPPAGHARTLGALLGGAVADTLSGCPTGGSVSSALADLAAAYSDQHTADQAVEVANRHVGVHGPAWLLPVALVVPEQTSRAAEVAELAAAAQAEPSSLPALVAWVELAARLWRGYGPNVPTQVAGQGQRGQWAACGDTAADALSAGMWALHRVGAEQSRQPSALVNYVAGESTPGTSCAVAVLLGLDLGASAWPARWHEQAAAESQRLTFGLLRAYRPWPRVGLPAKAA